MSEVSEKVAQLLYSKMANSPLFPFDTKHYRAKPHMRDSALLANSITIGDSDTHIFEIGNENAETLTPHYHILEDAQTIHYGNRRARRVVKNKDGTTEIRAYGKPRSWGTNKSKGSQANVSSGRDYGKWSYTDKGKLAQEYRSGGSKGKPSETSTAYTNIHYHYIERILEQIVPQVAKDIGATIGRSSLDFDDEVLEALSDNEVYYEQYASMVGSTKI